MVDVLRTMDILDEEKSHASRKERERQVDRDFKKLKQRRKDHPEEFFGLADVLRAAAEKGIAVEPKTMPSVRTVWPDFDPDRNAGNLERLKAEAAKVAEKFKSTMKGECPIRQKLGNTLE